MSIKARLRRLEAMPAFQVAKIPPREELIKLAKAAMKRLAEVESIMKICNSSSRFDTEVHT